jgi:hypothetical protein
MLKYNIPQSSEQLAERGKRKHDGCKILMCSMSTIPLWAYVSKK